MLQAQDGPETIPNLTPTIFALHRCPVSPRQLSELRCWLRLAGRHRRHQDLLPRASADIGNHSLELGVRFLST